MPQLATLTSTVVSTETFVRYDDSAPNKSVYHGSGHSDTARIKFETLRTGPKPVGNYNGTRKALMKLTRDITVATPDGGTTKAAMIHTLSSSIPVGASADDIEASEYWFAEIMNGTIEGFSLRDLEVKGWL